MASKSYGIHDKWTDINKINNVDIKSVDGVIESVKINGEEAGGGGSSDFSTANVTVVYPSGVTNATVWGAFRFSASGIDASIPSVTTSGDYGMILYKGGGIVMFTLGTGRSVTVSGNAEDMGDDSYLITGDCTITIS